MLHQFGFAASPRWRQPPLFVALTAPEAIEISRPSDQRRCHQIAPSRAQAAIAIPTSAGRTVFERRRWICVNLDRSFIDSDALLIVFYILLRGERESAIFGAAIHLDCWTAAFAILRRRAQLSRRRFGRTWLLTAASTITCRRTRIMFKFWPERHPSLIVGWPPKRSNRTLSVQC